MVHGLGRVVDPVGDVLQGDRRLRLHTARSGPEPPAEGESRRTGRGVLHTRINRSATAGMSSARPRLDASSRTAAGRSAKTPASMRRSARSTPAVPRGVQAPSETRRRTSRGARVSETRPAPPRPTPGEPSSWNRQQARRAIHRRQVGPRVAGRDSNHLVPDRSRRDERGLRAVKERGVEPLRPAQPRLVAQEVLGLRLARPRLEQPQGPAPDRLRVPRAVAQGHPRHRLAADHERVLVLRLLPSLLRPRLPEATARTLTLPSPPLARSPHERDGSRTGSRSGRSTTSGPSDQPGRTTQ